MKRDFKDRTEVTVLPAVQRDNSGNVLPSKTVVTIEIVPHGNDFSLRIDTESAPPEMPPPTPSI